MDENLWCALPEDILDRILAWLPLRSLIRARGVCKRWRWLVSSRSFLDVCAEIPPRDKYFLMFPSLGEQIVCSAFDITAMEWYAKIPSLTFLPPQVKYVEGGGGGLLFFSVNLQTQATQGQGEVVTLYVCNPITESWRKLPPMTYKRMPLVRHMVVDRMLKRYNIIVAGNAELFSPIEIESQNENESDGNHNRFRSTEVYDSSTDSWAITGNLPPDVDLNWSSAYCNRDGLLYCIANCFGTTRLGLITYNLREGVWSEGIEELPERFSMAQVVEWEGRILIVAEEHYKNDVLKTIHVLEFISALREWKEVSKLPRGLLVEFRRICEDESFNCVMQDGKIFLTSFRGIRVLVFDMMSKSWGWLSSCSCPSPSSQGMECRAVGFLLEPNLHMYA